jgi:hypothetical protein
MMLLGISCVPQRPKFDPDAYRANHYLEAIVNEKEDVVYADEPLFSEFACMHRSKWEELRKFVQLLRLPPDQKSIILKNLDFVNDRKIQI